MNNTKYTLFAFDCVENNIDSNKLSNTEPGTGTGILGIQSCLNNVGIPMSRVQTEKVRVSIFDVSELRDKSGIFQVSVPSHIINIEEWLLEIAQQLNWPDLEEAARHLTFPKERLLVLSADEKKQTDSLSPQDLLRNAVILSKCSGNFYNPDSAMILTRNRLNRCVELIKINLDNYYGLD